MDVWTDPYYGKASRRHRLFLSNSFYLSFLSVVSRPSKLKPTQSPHSVINSILYEQFINALYQQIELNLEYPRPYF